LSRSARPGSWPPSSIGSPAMLLELLFSAVIPVVVIIYMLKFSKSYPDRVAHHTS
jgi:hypothetical protein